MITLRRFTAFNSIQTFSTQMRTVGSMQLTNVPSRRAPLTNAVRTEIALTQVEDQICTLLDECTQKLKADKGFTTSCRIAGGWVRDKLLGSDSNDIDVALTDMMGYPFAEYFVEFVGSKKNKDLPVKTVVKIESNPDQSKHLETARTKVLGVELDFVNLRSEEYVNHSRIPIGMTFGTPLQDALRRDITINALFYNVHSRTVEDFTEKGLPDLRNGVIRTPLAPEETFRDDPLRVVRCIRFASRFGFEMVPELQEAARHPQIQDALSSKLSRERVGEEVDKMMKGRDPLHAIQLIHKLDLHDSIFSIPTPISSTFSSQPAPFSVSLAAATLLRVILYPPPPPPAGTSLEHSHPRLPAVHPTLLLSSVTAHDSSCTPRLFLAAALTSYRGITYTDAKGKVHPAVEAAIRDGLKLGVQNHYLDGIPRLFHAADLIKHPRLNNGERFVGKPERVAIGLLLRNKSVHNPNTGSHWASSILFSLVQELVSLYDPVHDHLDVETATDCIDVYNTFVDRIEELKLPTEVEARPILDGREVVKILGGRKPGAWTGHVLAQVIEWQLEFPDATKDECAKWLRAENEAGRVREGDDDRARLPARNEPPGKGVKISSLSGDKDQEARSGETD